MKRMLAIFIVLSLIMGTLLVLPPGKGSEVETRAPGRTLYVAPMNSTYNETRDALMDAMEGDTIYIAPGIYDTGLMITTSDITVIGNSSEGDVIIGQIGEGIAGIHARNVTVSGVTLTDDRNHIGVMSITNADGSRMMDVSLISQRIGEGLYIRDSYGLEFINITVRTNDRQSVRIVRSEEIVFENFGFSCNSSFGGCLELDTTDNITLRNGDIETRGEGTSIYDLSGGDLFLYDVTSDHTGYFLMMETGNISMFDMDISPAEIYMDFPEPTHTVRSFNQRMVKAIGTGPEGNTIPLEGAEINITSNSRIVYSTPFFGGMDERTGADGYLPEAIPFLSWYLRGGDTGYTNGTNWIEARFVGDEPGRSQQEWVDANLTGEVVISIPDVYVQLRTLEGYIVYLDGPMVGEAAENAIIRIIRGDFVEIGNFTVNETGHFVIDKIPVLDEFTVEIEPVDLVEMSGIESGYLKFTATYNITDDELINFTIAYYESNIGSVYGNVKYLNGPKDGLFCQLALVELYNETEKIGMTTTNGTGYYEFSGLEFPGIYELRITPPEDDLGVNLNTTGYLFWDGAGFYMNETTMVNAALNYYEHFDPVSPHPKITILDENDVPVEGAQVEVTINGATYRAITNMFGTAVFEGLEMQEFPEGSKFRVSKEGYDDIAWAEGEETPAFKESEDGPRLGIIIPLIIFVMLVIALAAYLIFFRKDASDLTEE